MLLEKYLWYTKECSYEYAYEYFDGKKLAELGQIPCFVWSLVGYTDPCCRSDVNVRIIYTDGHVETNYCWNCMWNNFIFIIKRFAVFFTFISYYIFYIFYIIFWFIAKGIFYLILHCKKIDPDSLVHVPTPPEPQPGPEPDNKGPNPPPTFTINVGQTINNVTIENVGNTTINNQQHKMNHKDNETNAENKSDNIPIPVQKPEEEIRQPNLYNENNNISQNNYNPEQKEYEKFQKVNDVYNNQTNELPTQKDIEENKNPSPNGDNNVNEVPKYPENVDNDNNNMDIPPCPQFFDIKME